MTKRKNNKDKPSDYAVKKITSGVWQGKWGVYKGNTLLMTWDTKRAADMDRARRKEK